MINSLPSLYARSTVSEIAAAIYVQRGAQSVERIPHALRIQTKQSYGFGNDRCTEGWLCLGFTNVLLHFYLLYYCYCRYHTAVRSVVVELLTTSQW